MRARIALPLLLLGQSAIAAPQGDAPPAATPPAPAASAPVAADPPVVPVVPVAPVAVPPADAPPPAPTVKPPAPPAGEVFPPTPVVALPTGVPSAAQVLVPTEPLAGYANGNFWIRDPNDWFVLYPKGRLQVDTYFFLNRGDAPKADSTCMDMPGMPCATVEPNGPKDTRPRDTIFVRRARAELQGTFLKHWDFSIAGEFASTPATGAYATMTDVFIVADYFSFAKLQIGQFDAPFTLENRTSDKYFDYMERSLAVRAFGVPANKETGLMLWGYPDNHLFYYSIGLFNGDGQNLKSLDGQPAVIGRAFVAPFALIAKDRRWMQDIWVGGSIWWKDAKNEGGPGPAAPTGGAVGDLPSLSTQGGLGFFSAAYGNGKDAMGNSIRSHLAPNGTTFKWAVEANVPIKRVGFRFELVHQSIDLSRYDDTNVMGNATRSGPLGAGNLTGTGFYVEAYGWILGDVNFLETPGLELMPRVRRFKLAEPAWALMVTARYEHVDLDVTGLTQPSVARDPSEGHYQIDAFELGVNAWGTKHVRLSANYVANYIGSGDPANPTARTGHAKNITGNLFYQRLEHELLFRVGIAL